MVQPELGELSVYVRGGAILPLAPIIQSTEEIPDSPLKLRVYPGPECHGSVYADDGESFAYRKGDFLRVNFNCRLNPRSLEVDVSANQGSYKPFWKKFQFEIFGIKKAPKQVRVAGQSITGWSFDQAREELTVTLPSRQNDMKLQIVY